MKEIHRGINLYVIFEYEDIVTKSTKEHIESLQYYCDQGWFLEERLSCPRDLTYTFKFVKFPMSSTVINISPLLLGS